MVRASDREKKKNEKKNETGAIRTRVSFPAAAKAFSPRATFQCRLSYGVRTVLVCNRVHQHVCARSESQPLAAIPLFGHTKILKNTGRNG